MHYISLKKTLYTIKKFSQTWEQSVASSWKYPFIKLQYSLDMISHLFKKNVTFIGHAHSMLHKQEFIQRFIRRTCLAQS